ncbi:MAG: alkaline phosphatase PhoX [Fimbriimonas sp.]
MQLDRRDFLRGGLVGLAGLAARPALTGDLLSRQAGNDRGGYGPLKPKAARNTGETMLALPDGFEYNVFGKTGDKMADGLVTPSAHDGMAAFQVDGMIRLIRNHEVRDKPKAQGSIASEEKSYDPTAGGGTTTLVVDPKSRELKRDWVSVSGTLVNCAGGPTPWGSWLTCEETTVGTVAGQVYHKDATVASYAKDHGYIFEVPVLGEGPADPKPIRAMGRFVHEAIAVDPSTGIVYQTEDTGAAGFYRYIPDKPGRLHEGGKLQMLAVKGKPALDTRKGQKNGMSYECEWVDIKDPDPAAATTKPATVYQEGLAKGGATFGRLEGAWYGDGCIYINSTDGGDAKCGQVWRYRPMGLLHGELTLIFESPSKEILDAPDNLCVSPRGSLVICEDGDGVNYVRGLTQQGVLFDVAQNVLNESEFAGATFSPDGETLFFNIQTPGITIAMWGPWRKGVL